MYYQEISLFPSENYNYRNNIKNKRKIKSKIKILQYIGFFPDMY